MISSIEAQQIIQNSFSEEKILTELEGRIKKCSEKLVSHTYLNISSLFPVARERITTKLWELGYAVYFKGENSDHHMHVYEVRW